MDKVIELARETGATPYTNRHYPNNPHHTFSLEQLQKFYAIARADLEAENAKLRDRHDEISNALFRKGANTRRLKVENAKLKAAMQLIATAENSALDLAYCKGVVRAALGEK